MSGAPALSILCEKCYKNQLFAFIRILWISLSCLIFFEGFGTNLDGSWCLGDGLDLDDFQRLSGGSPELIIAGWVMVIWALAGPHCSNQTVWRSSSTCKMQHQTCRSEGIRKNRMRTAKIRKSKAAVWSHPSRGTRIQDRANSSQLGGPSTEGPAD